MSKRFYTIARHTVSVEGGTEPDLLALIPGFAEFETGTGAADLQIAFGHDVEIPDTEPNHRFSFDESAFVCRYYATDSAQCFTMTGSDGNCYAMRYNGGDMAEASPVENPDALRFMLWMAFAMFGSTRSTAPIHSACVVCNGEGIIFLGESGTGKSTHARLWLKNIDRCQLLNDDSPIITVENRKPMIYGSPWSGKTHCYHNEGYPLQAIVRLHQADRNLIEPLGTLHAVAAIEPSLPPALRYNVGLETYRIDFIASIIQNCRVFSLWCRPDSQAAELCSKVVMGR